VTEHAQHSSQHSPSRAFFTPLTGELRIYDGNIRGWSFEERIAVLSQGGQACAFIEPT
jgi:hypothetical protein